MLRETSIAKALARVFIAAAWTRGTLPEAETDALKDLLYQLPALHKSDWEELQELLENPVSPRQAEYFQRELSALLGDEDQAIFAAYAIERVTGTGNGAGTPPSPAVLAQLNHCLGKCGQDSLLCMYRLIEDSLLKRRQTDITEDLRRLSQTQAWLEGRVGGLMAGKWEQPPAPEELCRLSLAGILLSQIIYADGRVDEREVLTVEQYLCEEWGLSEEKAQFVVQISLSDRVENIDLMRVCRWFYEATEKAERIGFLNVLFDVAMADGVLDETEIDIIMRLAADLRFEQYHFQAALERVSGRGAA
ncbi:TerB family tellurite resistance protein [Ruficoccus amylovorans]|uniref:TerB family tellurite resistance protein n=1 Tax=Ruficoccus amylovorans TaxID=1804625 RepID=A0A842HCN7_9BACT|nr:TerB family tellurite resistance protein [Ruficoccus amylovorans]MBC2594010.1 TerB family tellurite resistance protein [Ruficoccus amylovorans]